MIFVILNEDCWMPLGEFEWKRDPVEQTHALICSCAYRLYIRFGTATLFLSSINGPVSGYLGGSVGWVSALASGHDLQDQASGHCSARRLRPHPLLL